MIPIDASKPLVKEKDGVKYFFRYCTEEIEDQFISLTESVVKKIKVDTERLQTVWA